MNTPIRPDEPHLQPPGAGLPWLELWIARWRFRRWRRGRSVAELVGHFDREERLLLDLVRPLSAEQAARRVLISRLRGLEDSSRYWSAWMTLDHLRIVNSGVARVVGVLGKGKSLPGQSNTADVKPDPGADATVVSGFQRAGEDLRNLPNRVSQWEGPARFAHSWFGPLDALGWLAMAATHMSLHRVQMERIVEEFRNRNA